MISNLQKGGGNIRRTTFGFINRVCHLFLLCFIFIIVSGCHLASGVSTTLKDDGKTVFKRIAVMPFQRIGPEDGDVRTLRCPVCGVLLTAEKNPPESEKVVEDVFIDRLKGQKGLTIIPPDRTGGIYERVTAGLFKTDIREVLKNVGNELGADGIVIGYVYRYRERKGYSYSAEKPASVAFEIHLIRVHDKAVIWRGNFDRTQTSLMENILQITFFYKERGRWVTAKELTEEGMEEVLQKFPGMLKD